MVFFISITEINKNITDLTDTGFSVESFNDKGTNNLINFFFMIYKSFFFVSESSFYLDTKSSSLNDQLVETNNIRDTFQNFSELELSSLTNLIKEDKNLFDDETSNYVKK